MRWREDEWHFLAVTQPEQLVRLGKYCTARIFRKQTSGETFSKRSLFRHSSSEEMVDSSSRDAPGKACVSRGIENTVNG